MSIVCPGIVTCEFVTPLMVMWFVVVKMLFGAAVGSSSRGASVTLLGERVGVGVATGITPARAVEAERRRRKDLVLKCILGIIDVELKV